MRRLRNDERGLAIGFVLFFAALTVAALFWILADPVINTLETTMSSQSDTVRGSQTITERVQIWDAILIYVLFVAGIGVIARAVFESGVR